MNVLKFSAWFVVLLFFVACGGSDGSAAPPSTPKPPETKPVSPKAKVIVVKNLENPHRFEPKTLEFKMGETYEIQLVGGGEYHTFTVNDFGINQIVEPGKTVSVVFKAEKSGTFDLQCLPHFTQGMVGKIIVK